MHEQERKCEANSAGQSQRKHARKVSMPNCFFAIEYPWRPLGGEKGAETTLDETQVLARDVETVMRERRGDGFKLH